MKIAYSMYELIAKTQINSKNCHQVRQGALLKVQFPDGKIGYADCHPWTELGDETLAQQLHYLGLGKKTPLTTRSLYFASLDAMARSDGRNLFTGLTIPKSHFLIANVEYCDMLNLELALKEGYNCFKIKLGNRLEMEWGRVESILCHFSKEKLKIRLDFNCKLSHSSFKNFLEQTLSWHERIEFFEDPFAFEPKAWEFLQMQYGISLACDYHSSSALKYPQSAATIVIKSAVQDENLILNELRENQKLVVTSYLDHPIGQLAASYVAAQCYLQNPKQLGICGLLSHTIYQTNAFSEQLLINEAHLSPPDGTGFGFDLLLQNQSWSWLQ